MFVCKNLFSFVIVLQIVILIYVLSFKGSYPIK